MLIVLCEIQIDFNCSLSLSNLKSLANFKLVFKLRKVETSDH